MILKTLFALFAKIGKCIEEGESCDPNATGKTSRPRCCTSSLNILFNPRKLMHCSPTTRKCERIIKTPQSCRGIYDDCSPQDNCCAELICTRNKCDREIDL